MLILITLSSHYQDQKKIRNKARPLAAVKTTPKSRKKQLPQYQVQLRGGNLLDLNFNDIACMAASIANKCRNAPTGQKRVEIVITGIEVGGPGAFASFETRIRDAIKKDGKGSGAHLNCGGVRFVMTRE